MANIVCPGCSRIIDDTMKSCPGCKYNIKKYVKELKKKGAITGSINLVSAYGNQEEEEVPELDFLKPKMPAPDRKSVV